MFNVSADNEAIARLVHLQAAAAICPGEEVFGQRVADLFFHGVAHRARAEFRMESFTNQKRQNRFVQFQFVAACGEKLNFTQ